MTRLQLAMDGCFSRYNAWIVFILAHLSRLKPIVRTLALFRPSPACSLPVHHQLGASTLCLAEPFARLIVTQMRKHCQYCMQAPSALLMVWCGVMDDYWINMQLVGWHTVVRSPDESVQ